MPNHPQECAPLPTRIEAGEPQEALIAAYLLGATLTLESDGSHSLSYPDNRLTVAEVRTDLMSPSDGRLTTAEQL